VRKLGRSPPKEANIANYWGLDAIARRMDVDSTTIRRWYRLHGFLMMRRRRKVGRTWQTLWYTNDPLIHAWELDQCKRQAEGRDTIAGSQGRAPASHTS